MQDDFVANLRLLCGFYPSIAEVCRRLEINRSQFNRYLSGRFRPRHSVLRHMCVLFGVEEHELFLPHDVFCKLVQGDGEEANRFPITPEWPEGFFPQGKEGMNKYLGNYFEYYYSMSRPGHLIRTLVSIEEREYGMVYQRTEKMRSRPGSRICHNRYQGLAFRLADRLFLIDYEMINGNEITQTILFPSFQSRLSYLTGLRLGVADNSERMPCCVRVVYEKLTDKINVRSALSACGLISDNDPSLDTEICRNVQNDIGLKEHQFRARHSSEFSNNS